MSDELTQLRAPDQWNLESPTPGQIAAAKHLLKNWSRFNVEWEDLGEPGKRLLLMSAWDILKAAREADTKPLPPAVSQEDVALVDNFFDPATPAPDTETCLKIVAAWQRIKQSLATHPKIPGEP